MNKSFLKLVRDFNLSSNDFNELIPYLTNNVNDLEGFDGNDVGKLNSIKTLWEISNPKKIRNSSRMWRDPHAYRFLVQWSNAVLLRLLIRKFTGTLPFKESRTKTQLDDAGRSIVSNIEEGFRRPDTRSYLEFLGFAEGSLEEVSGLIKQCLQDGFLRTIKGKKLSDLGINLQMWNEYLKDPINSSKILYFPLEGNRFNYKILKDIKGRDLTYEMFMELINKTDYVLRNLVRSLEKKANGERKYYQVEKIRLGMRSRGI
jgi:four helix bundle protein